MKKKLKVIIPIFVIIIAVAVTASMIICKNLAVKRLYSSYYTLKENFIVECVNGSYGKNENSSEYIKTALNSGINSIEVDLCFDKDGKPFIEKEQKNIGEKTVSLEKLLEYISSDVSYDSINICLHLKKEASNLQAVDELSEKFNFQNRIYYTGVSLSQAQYVRNQSKIPFYLSIDVSKYKNPNELIEFFSLVSNSMAKGITCDVDAMTEDIYNILHENFIEISFENINSANDFAKCAKYSPSRISTSNPFGILEVLHHWQNNAPLK